MNCVATVHIFYPPLNTARQFGITFTRLLHAASPTVAKIGSASPLPPIIHQPPNVGNPGFGKAELSLAALPTRGFGRRISARSEQQSLSLLLSSVLDEV